MKRSEMVRCFTPGMSRDEMRKKSYSMGFGNIYQETEMDSAMVDCHQDISYLADYMEQHSHMFYEIIYCVQGTLTYLLGVRRYQVSVGDVIIIPPGIIHSPILKNPLDVPYERYVVWISAAFASILNQANSVLADFQEATVLHTAGTKWEYLSRYFYTGIKEAETQAPGWEVCLGGNTAQLVAHLARATHDLNTVRPSQNEELLKKVLEYIQNNLADKLSVRTTAQHFHVSESTLTHLFRRELKTGFYKCVTQRRMAEAKNLIHKGYSMELVSQSVGFSEYSAFYRAFKSEYGVSPLEYQKMTRR